MNKYKTNNIKDKFKDKYNKFKIKKYNNKKMEN